MNLNRFGLSLTLVVGMLAPGAHAQEAPVMRAGAAQTTEAMGFVQSNAQRVMEEVKNRHSEFESNPHALHDFVSDQMLELMDRDQATRLVLGVHARGASSSDIERFGTALAKNLAARYGKVLLEIDLNEPVMILGQSEMPRGRGVKVSTQVLRRNGKAVRVDYILSQTDGQWRVFDVMVEGFSYAMTLKSAFNEDLRSQSIAQVTEQLEARTRRSVGGKKEAGSSAGASRK